MRKLTISAISFVNTAPLMWDFTHGNAASGFEFSCAVPAKCAEALQAGTADIAIIPAATYATIPGLLILPDIAIAAKGPVRSILLVSHKQLSDIRTVATDTSSRTTVALARLLFRKHWGGDREFYPADPDLDTMLQRADAALIIGDPALKVDRSKYHTWDLSEEWMKLTGKPFVFAFWAVRLQSISELQPGLDLGDVFRRSMLNGTRPDSIAGIAREWSPRLGLSEPDITWYLTRSIHYHLDPECISGLELFFRLLEEEGFIPHAPELRFLGALTLLAKVRH